MDYNENIHIKRLQKKYVGNPVILTGSKYSKNYGGKKGVVKSLESDKTKMFGISVKIELESGITVECEKSEDFDLITA